MKMGLMNEIIIGPSIKYKLPEMLWALPEFLFSYKRKEKKRKEIIPCSANIKEKV